MHTPRNWHASTEAVLLPVTALAAALLLFGVFCWFGGQSPTEVWSLLFKGAFGDAFSWQNTLQRAAPLMLTALAVALPAQAGLTVIGGEGALALGALGCAALPYVMPVPGGVIGSAMVLASGALLAALWVAIAGVLRQWRRVNETISSLLLGYIAIALFKHCVEGPMRDPASLNKPSTRPLEEALRIGAIAPDSFLGDVHWGLVIGIAACVLFGAWLSFTAQGFSLRVVGGQRPHREPGGPGHQSPGGARLRAGGRVRGPRGRHRGGRGADLGQRLVDRRHGLHRHPGELRGAPQPVGPPAGGHPVRRLRRGRQPVATPPGPARRVGAGAALRLRVHPERRGAAREAVSAADHAAGLHPHQARHGQQGDRMTS